MSGNPRAKSHMSESLSCGNLTVKFYEKNPLAKSLTAKMSHKKHTQKVKGLKITQQILTAQNPTAEK